MLIISFRSVKSPNHVSSFIYPENVLIYKKPLKDGESSPFSNPSAVFQPDCKHTPERYSPLHVIRTLSRQTTGQQPR